MGIKLIISSSLLFIFLSSWVTYQQWEIDGIKKELAAQKLSNNAAADAVKQFEKDVFAEIQAKETLLLQRAAAEQAAIRNDLKSLPADNFRQPPKKWGDN